MTAIKIESLKKVYNNGFEALKGINLEVQQGDFFALLGPNGAGKTTAIGIICSLVNKTAGKVSVFGHDIDTQLSQAKACLGLVPQEFNFDNFAPIEQILLNQAGFYGIPRRLARQRAEYYLKKLELWDKRKQAARTLSGGMKRRLMIARALIHEPKMLILDEPTAGVDIEIRHSMWNFIKEINADGTTVILTTHYLEEAESLCRNIAILDHGEIIENTSMRELLTRLETEIFILDTKSPVQTIPKLAGIGCELIDSHTLEISLEKSHSINHVFDQLTRQGIDILSMRNKSNRLEQLFVNLVGSND